MVRTTPILLKVQTFHICTRTVNEMLSLQPLDIFSLENGNVIPWHQEYPIEDRKTVPKEIGDE